MIFAAIALMGYTFRGNNSQLFLPPFSERVYFIKGNNLLPLGANSFLISRPYFRSGIFSWEQILSF